MIGSLLQLFGLGRPELSFCYARINEKVMPIDRGERYEDPIHELLTTAGLGEVSGGGTLTGETGEIESVGIDLDVRDIESAIPMLVGALTRLGVPKGSAIEFPDDDDRDDVPCGEIEGIGLYLNGTDLPGDVYSSCDINFVWNEINQLLGDYGAIRSYWQGPTETALYLYGPSAEKMLELIDDFVCNYPLCERSRRTRIA